LPKRALNAHISISLYFFDFDIFRWSTMDIDLEPKRRTKIDFAILLKKLGISPGFFWGAVVSGFFFVGGGVLIENTIENSLPTDWIQDRIQRLQVSRMPDATYNILVANLQDDDEKLSQTAHVQHSLEKTFSALRQNSAVRVQRALRPLKVGWSQDVSALAKAEIEGQSWLDAFNADILIWGRVTDKDRLLRLHLLPRRGGGTSDAKGYQLGRETLVLAKSFNADLGTLLVAQAVAAANPVYGTANFVSDVLGPQVSRLEGLLKSPPRDLSSDQVQELRETFAFAASSLGDQTGERELLDRAVTEFRKVVDYWDSKNAPKWSRTQDRLGNALMRLGERTNSTELLWEAVEAFDRALTVRTLEQGAFEWAITSNHRANALLRIGEREQETDKIREAIDGYQKALSALDPGAHPLDWAMVQNNLGTGYATLGTRETDMGALNEALNAYEAAQDHQDRETVPVAWAMTARNIATVRATLGERLRDEEQVRIAVELLKGVLAKLDPTLAPLEWGATQHILGFALVIQGQLQGSNELIVEAVAAFQEALNKRTLGRAAQSWARTQTSLAEALLILAERDPSKINVALKALDESLSVRTKDRVPLAWAETKMLTSEAHLRAARVNNGATTADRCENVRRGQVASREALDVLNGLPGINRFRTEQISQELGLQSTVLNCMEVHDASKR
jgi:tetratricopeptide (TPR) repeat protein